MKLTKVERLTISQQLRILAAVDEDSAAEYNERALIIERGYVGLYDQVFDGLWEETEENVVDEVQDILDLYRAFDTFKRRGNALPSGHYSEFQGFDGNHESSHHSVCSFLIDEQGNWAELKSRPRNSHATSLPSYRRMLAEWQKIKKEFNLTPAQVADIVAAGDR